MTTLAEILKDNADKFSTIRIKRTDGSISPEIDQDLSNDVQYYSDYEVFSQSSTDKHIEIVINDIENIVHATATLFSSNYNGSKEHFLNGTTYICHDVDIFNTVNFKGKSYPAVYQTGMKYYNNDYSTPMPDVNISRDGGTEDFIHDVASASSFDICSLSDSQAHEFGENYGVEIVNRAELRALKKFMNEQYSAAQSYLFKSYYNHEFLDKVEKELGIDKSNYRCDQEEGEAFLNALYRDNDI